MQQLSMQVQAPPLTEVQRYKCNDVIEIHNGIIFNFYTGLPHVFLVFSPFGAHHYIIMAIIKDNQV